MHSHVIIVGAQRSGTTFLYQALDGHPDVCMAKPIRPEPKFFLREDAVALGRAAYLAAHFQHARDERVLGEKSTSYIEYEDVAIRIRNMLPAARIVMMLRDPVLRAYSNWRFSRDHGIEELGFDAALAAEPERSRQWDQTRYSVCPFAYAGRGDYVRYLDLWAKHFPRAQIVTVTSESLFDESSGALAGLFRWLGLAENQVPAPGRVNAATGEGDIEPAILQQLRDRYRESNQRLADEWQVDISPWQT
jgi:hypothetical protein